MNRTQALAVGIAALTAPYGAAWAASGRDWGATRPLQVVVDADRVQYDAAGRRATLQGNVRVVVCSADSATPRAMLQAHSAEADLQRGEIRTTDGRVLAGPALLAGSELQLDLPGQRFTVTDAEGYAALAGPTDPLAPMPTAYFQGERITRLRSVVFILRGRITTCDRDDPHYAVYARRIKYYLDTGDLVVHNAGVRLYGLDIPLLPWAKIDLSRHRGRRRKFNPIPAPGLSSREGIYLPYSFRLTRPGSSWPAFASVRLTEKIGVTGSVHLQHQLGSWNLDLVTSRREWVLDNIEDELGLSRLPEVSLTWQPDRAGNRTNSLQAGLALGSYQEVLEKATSGIGPRPRVTAQRAQAVVGYTAAPEALASHEGAWYGARARASTYSTGESFADLELFGGVGACLTGDLSGWLGLRRHFPGGSTPFLFDDVDIRTELQAGAQLRLTDRWGVEGWGRYDLDRGDLRDYTVTLSHRAHCLTWGIFYQDVGNQLGLTVDLTGITDDSPPCRTRSRLQTKMEQQGLFVVPPEPRSKPGTTRSPAVTCPVSPPSAQRPVADRAPPVPAASPH